MANQADFPDNWSHNEKSPFKLQYNKKDFDPFMQMAANTAIAGVMQKHGGPFGCTITQNGRPIAVAHNTVITDTNPSCHAEFNAIKLACKTLQTTDLSDCVIYASGSPCPMCYGAILLAHMKTLYIGVNLETSHKYTFSDLGFYDQLKMKQQDRKIPIKNNVMADVIMNMLETGEKPTMDDPSVTDNGHMENEDEFFMKKAIQIAKFAQVKPQFEQKLPFGTIIVKDGQIIGSGTSEMYEKNDVTLSAEIDAIKNACQTLKAIDLGGCTAYTVIEPSLMSYACLMWSRISKIVYGVSFKDLKQYFGEDIKHYQDAQTGEFEGIKQIDDCMSSECEDVFKIWAASNCQWY